MEQVDYEVIIVGGGIMGSTTAYYLSNTLGNKVLLLEQFDFLHRKGSSHGDSRVIRQTYAEEHYLELMTDSFKLWKEAQDASGTNVYTETGILDFGNKNTPSILKLIETAVKHNVEHEVITDAQQLSQKFPMLTLQPGSIVVYSPNAGILNPTKSLLMFQNLARANGCKLIDNSPVTSITHNNDKIIVETNNQLKLRARKCILTCGPWAKKILKSMAHLELPLETTQITVAYWKVDQPEMYSSKTFPVFLKYDEPQMYGLPVHEFPKLIKICGFGGPKQDPDERTFEPGHDLLKDVVSPWIQKVFTGVNKNPSLTETCICTDTPDGDYIIDQVPGFPQASLLIGCGFSGHGFKLAPVVGNILAKWAISGEFPYSSKLQNIFGLNRFSCYEQSK